MSRITRAHPYMSAEELRSRLKEIDDRSTTQKVLVVLNAVIEPALAEDIGMRAGVATQTVHNWMSTYNRFGPEALFDKKPRKPLPRLFTDEEERSFMEPFIQKAEDGQIAGVAEIQRSFEQLLGFGVHISTIYRLLARHQWRKIKPRPKHPKGDPKAREDFKKNSRKR
jgi:transposase